MLQYKKKHYISSKHVIKGDRYIIDFSYEQK